MGLTPISPPRLINVKKTALFLKDGFPYHTLNFKYLSWSIDNQLNQPNQYWLSITQPVRDEVDQITITPNWGAQKQSHWNVLWCMWVALSGWIAWECQNSTSFVNPPLRALSWCHICQLCASQSLNIRQTICHFWHHLQDPRKHWPWKNHKDGVQWLLILSDRHLIAEIGEMKF